MSMTVRCAFKKFLNDNKDVCCSWGMFATLRPKKILLLTRYHLATCKCPYCQNVEFVLTAINRKVSSLQIAGTEKSKLKMYTVYDVLNTVMCNKTAKFHRPECISGDCEHCTNTS